MTTLALPSSAVPTSSGPGLALPGNLARRSPGLAIPISSPALSSAGGPAGPSKAGSAGGKEEADLSKEIDGGDEGDVGDADVEADAEVGAGGKSKKRKSVSAAAGTSALGAAVPALEPAAPVPAPAAGKEYRYSGEISQMMFVFGEVQDPLLETVKLVEDIVRGQIVEIITRARHLTTLRASRFLSADDVIFLIRDDRGKVNRLRTYLSWKDVRKKAKDDESGEAGAEVDMDDAEKMTAKIRNTMVKLPWELLTPFSDLLKGLPSSQNREDDEEQDEDEMQAYQDSMQRLRDADEITKKMTKDEYVHYSDCRQASFTYRKAKRFRDFVNFAAYLDTGPNDDIVDILGFLSFEMVRTLCVKSLDVRDRLEKKVVPTSNGKSGTGPVRRNTGKAAPTGSGGQGNTSSPAKRKGAPGCQGNEESLGRTTSPERLGGSTSPDSPPSALPPHAPSAAPQMAPPSTSTTTAKRQKTADSDSKSTHTKHGTTSDSDHPVSLFAPPPSARQPLLPAHVLEAFAQIQREQAGSRMGGMRNFRGGIMRGKLALV